MYLEHTTCWCDGTDALDNANTSWASTNDGNMERLLSNSVDRSRYAGAACGTLTCRNIMDCAIAGFLGPAVVSVWLLGIISNDQKFTMKQNNKL